jgi:hypothetical protein
MIPASGREAALRDNRHCAPRTWTPSSPSRPSTPESDREAPTVPHGTGPSRSLRVRGWAPPS